MAKTIEVKVPDIGNFKDVDVIEVMVKPGDMVAEEQGLVTLETDKAAMDVPSPYAGTVKEVKLKKGDKASEGTTVVSLEVDESAAAPVPKKEAAKASPAAPPAQAQPLKPAPAANLPEADGINRAVGAIEGAAVFIPCQTAEIQQSGWKMRCL